MAERLGISGPTELCEIRIVSCLLLPAHTVKYNELCGHYPHPRGLPLREYESEPKLLIGLDNLHLVVRLKIQEGCARDRLGWNIYGSVTGSSLPRAISQFHVAEAADSDRQINDQL